MKSGPATARTDLLLKRSASLPQMLRNATIAAWLVRKRSVIHVMLRWSFVSMYTAKNGVARFMEKYQVPEEQEELPEVRVAERLGEGGTDAADAPRFIRGSGIRVRKPTPTKPVTAATARRIVYTPISGVTRAL